MQDDPQVTADALFMKQLMSLLEHLCWQVLAPVPSARQSLQSPAVAQSWLEVQVDPQEAAFKFATIINSINYLILTLLGVSESKKNSKHKKRSSLISHIIKLLL